MTPLYESLRPKELNEVFGQNEVVKILRHFIETKKPMSLLLYGPPGSGKTTLARIYAKAFQHVRFFSLSAVTAKVTEIKSILNQEGFFGQKTLLFIDEIHRLNKAQQDVFLPFIEDGSLILVAATTENPSFNLNNALLSRLRVLTLKSLEENDLKLVLSHFEKRKEKKISEPLKEELLFHAKGDARHLFNLLENLDGKDLSTLPIEEAKAFLQKKRALYDKDADGHYHLISALHKSVRGSDPDAAIYWLCRMLKAGEEPLFLARRLIRIAAEDIGLADPHALRYALDAHQMYQMLGSPEGELGLAQAVIYLALAPKSNRVYVAMKKASTMADKTNASSPPKKILNAPTKLMKESGYGEDYIYDHDTKNGFSGQNYFPDGMQRPEFYQPVQRGFERDMEKRLAYFNKLRST